jgi:nucleoid-associated protein YgaU
VDAETAARTLRPTALATGALLLCGGGLRLCWMAAAGPLHSIQASGPDAPEDLIVVGAAALGGVLLAWLAFGAMLSALAAVPGAAGRIADAVAVRVAPAAVRRAITVLLGTALMTAPISAAHSAGSQPAPSPDATTSHVVGPPPPDPGFGVTTRQPVADGGAPDPGGSVPLSTTMTARDPAFGAGMPAPTPAAPVASRPAKSPPTAPGLGPLGPVPQTPSSTWSRTITVVRGDTLWAIAARHLGPDASPLQVAREWPRWYAANRTVIGSNPDLIRVGQILTVPTPGASS